MTLNLLINAINQLKYYEDKYPIASNEFIHQINRIIWQEFESQNFQFVVDLTHKILENTPKNNEYNLFYQFFLLAAQSQNKNLSSDEIQKISEQLINLGNGQKIIAAHYECAKLLTNYRQDNVAMQIFSQLLKFYNPEQLARHCNSRQMVIYNLALAQTNPRVQKIMTPSQILGEAQNKITDSQISTIKLTLDKAFADFNNNISNKPLYAGKFNIAPLTKPLKIMVLLGRYAWGTELGGETDVSFEIHNSAIKRGHQVLWYNTDKISTSQERFDKKFATSRIIDGVEFRGSPEVKSQELDNIDQKIHQFQPDWLVCDIFENAGQDYLNIQDLLTLKNKYNCKLFSVHPDYYANSVQDTSDPIADTTDLYEFSVVFADIHPKFQEHLNNGKAVFFAQIPHSYAKAPPEKHYNMNFMGYGYKNRDAFLAGYEDFIPNNKIQLNNRVLVKDSNKYPVFIDEITKSRFGFSNGYLPPTAKNIAPGRIFECIANFCLVFNENDDKIREIFVPFVHYIPVDNRHEIIIFSQFFQKYPEYWQKIVESAHNFMINNYSPDHFWTLIESRMAKTMESVPKIAIPTEILQEPPTKHTIKFNFSPEILTQAPMQPAIKIHEAMPNKIAIPTEIPQEQATKQNIEFKINADNLGEISIPFLNAVLEKTISVDNYAEFTNYCTQLNYVFPDIANFLTIDNPYHDFMVHYHENNPQKALEFCEKLDMRQPINKFCRLIATKMQPLERHDYFQIANELTNLDQRYASFEVFCTLAYLEKEKFILEFLPKLLEIYPAEYLRQRVNSKQSYYLNLYLSIKDSRIHKILLASPFLGQPELQITAQQNQKIQDLLDKNAQDFHENKLPKREFEGKYISKPNINPKKFLILTAKHIGTTELLQDSAVSYLYYNSLKMRGHQVEIYFTDKCLIHHERYMKKYGKPRIINGKNFVSTPETKKQEIANIAQIISEFKPDIVYFESFWQPNEDTIQNKDFHYLKTIHPFKLVTLYTDAVRGNPLGYDVWNESTDFFCTYRANHEQFEYHNKLGKIILNPILPYAKFKFIPTKTQNFIFSGRNHRNRDAFLCDFQKFVPTAKIHLNSTYSAQSKLTTQESIGELLSSKMTFSSGFVYDNLYMLTARIFEAIGAKTLLLEEEGSAVAPMYYPYIHYIPIQNRAELITYSQFFIANEDYRARITNDAYDFHMKNYSNDHIWTHFEDFIFDKK